jgi:uncharacterized RDD family membrane protein YckC
MMEKNPRDRYQNAKELVNELDEVAATLTTSEAKPANLIPRIFAFGIDVILAIIVAKVLFRGEFLAIIVAKVLFSVEALKGQVLVVLVIYAGIAVAWRGRTIGKSLFGLRVVDRSGQPLTWSRSFCRAFCYIVSIAPCCTGLIWALLNRKHDSVHDLITHTRVVADDGET